MYSAMAPWYDQLFPLSSQQLHFVSETVDPKAGPAILDIGCGTGVLAEALAQKGARVTGIDLDEGMIKEAKRSRNGPKFQVLDMMQIAETFAHREFDAILCMGNTLVHLPGIEEMELFIRAAASLLKTEGVLILQLLNYDHILHRRPEELPPLDGGPVSLHRSYQYLEDGVIFTTRLERKDHGTAKSSLDDPSNGAASSGSLLAEASVRLYPLLRGKLLGLLKAAGFRENRLYGSFSGDPLVEDSFPLIVVSKF